MIRRHLSRAPFVGTLSGISLIYVLVVGWGATSIFLISIDFRGAKVA